MSFPLIGPVGSPLAGKGILLAQILPQFLYFPLWVYLSVLSSQEDRNAFFRGETFSPPLYYALVFKFVR